MKIDIMFLEVNLVVGIDLNVFRYYDLVILFINNMFIERSGDVCLDLWLFVIVIKFRVVKIGINLDFKICV